MKITKGVILMAGRATRLLPLTKAVPKGMLPVAGKMILEYDVEELVSCGISNILCVVGPESEKIIKDHFSPDPKLLHLLAEQKKTESLKRIQALDEISSHLSFAIQEIPLGSGDALKQAKKFTSCDPFVLAFGDAIIEDGDKLLRRMAKSHQKNKSSVTIAVERLPREVLTKRGVVKPVSSSNFDDFQIRDIVEKPALDQIPSPLGVAARYILSPEIFEAIEATKGKGEEVEITDAIRWLIQRGKMVRCVCLKEREKRWNTGDIESYMVTDLHFLQRSK